MRLFSLLLVGLVPAFVEAQELDPEWIGTLPGERAPSLVVSRWLRGKPVDRFQPGRVYVLDLWATWCAPCLKSMPHMSRLQAQYSKELTVIAMNVWELAPERVPAVLEALGDSMPGTVATDSIPAGKEVNMGLTAAAYMGVEFASLPRTFLIDREGRIAWIGSPHELAGPLAQAVDGTWNPEPFATEYTAKMKVELRYRQLVNRVVEAVEAGDWEDAYRLSENVVAADSSFAPRIAHPGFALIAAAILKRAPGESAALAQRAAERSLELWGKPDWRLSKLAAEAARASGDLDAARGHLKRALESAPEEERTQLETALEDMPEAR